MSPKYYRSPVQCGRSELTIYGGGVSVIEACTSKLGPRAEEIVAMLGLQHSQSPQWSSCRGQQEGKDTANATLTIHCDPFSKWDTNAALGGWQMALRRSHSQCFKRRVLTAPQRQEDPMGSSLAIRLSRDAAATGRIRSYPPKLIKIQSYQISEAFLSSRL